MRAASVLAEAAEVGDSVVAKLFRGLAAADAGALSRALDAIVDADVAASGESGALAAARPLIEELPSAVRASGSALIDALYADRWGRAHFQGVPVARAWARARRHPPGR